MVGPKATFKIQRKSGISDNMGGFTTTWSDVVPIRGTLTNVERNEKFMSDATRVKSTHYFMTKYNPNITLTESDRLAFKTDIYEIIFVDNIAMQNRFWEISLRKIS